MEKRSFNIFGVGSVTVGYTECEHAASDNEIVIYKDYKISIHLSDGLYGVMNDRLVGGERGDVLLYAPNEVHFGRFAVSGSFRFVNIFLSEEFLQRAVAEYPPISKLFVSMEEDRTNCIRGSLEEKIKILDAAELLADFSKGEGACNAIKAFSIVLELLLLLTELYGRAQRGGSMPLGTPIVQRTVEYITKHYSDKLTLDELAKMAGCSTVYLSKCFKRYMGRSVHQYLTEYRISRAAALLHTGCSVTDACYGVGFSDCSSFIRTFQKMMKTTPHQYKKNKHNAD